MHRALPPKNATQRRGRERCQDRKIQPIGSPADQSAPLGGAAIRCLDEQRHLVMTEPVQNRFPPCHRLPAAPREAQEIQDPLAQARDDQGVKITRNPNGATSDLGKGALLQRFAQHIILRHQP